MASDKKKFKTVGPLTKTMLELIATISDCDFEKKFSKSIYPFFYGTGLDGLSDFEMELYGLSVGEQITRHFEADELKTYLGHLFYSVIKALNTQPPFNLKIRVVSITPATDRELVRALANKDGHVDDGCDCGCSC